MHVKLIEIRDRATMIPAMAIKMVSNIPAQRALLATSGYAQEPPSQCFILLVQLARATAQYDAYEWGDRTMCAAHQWIENNFSKIENGDVVDVEYILGETNQKKTSEVQAR